MNTRTTYLASKPHYEILDGLRGVAAVMVIIFHLFEAHAGGSHLTQIINHGYLAVDFFFMLSGFVIGYAYDDRWNRMTVGTLQTPYHPPASYGDYGKHCGRCLFLFSGVALFSTYREYVHRNNAAGDVAGLYLASSSAEVRHSRLDGNASVEWPGMVALL